MINCILGMASDAAVNKLHVMGELFHTSRQATGYLDLLVTGSFLDYDVALKMYAATKKEKSSSSAFATARTLE